MRALVGEAAQVADPVHQLFAPATGESPELFIEAQKRNSGNSPVITVTIRELGRDMDRLPDLTILFGLTRTEHKIIRMLVQGLSVRRIATELGTSVLTVRTHLKRTYGKVNVGTKEQLFATMLKLMVD